MSRGGRGGGFGRGGGRGGGGMGSNMPPMGLTFQELGTLMDKTPSQLYPTMSSMPRMEPAQEKELKYATYQLKFLEEQRHSPYWPTLQEKKQSDLSRFTDRYRPEAREQPSLKTVNMQEEVFPKGLWNSFMHTETQREELKAKKKAKRKINWDEYEERAAGEADDHAEASSEPDDLGDYEDEEDDDYAENYFDNGEDDDIGEDDGGEAAYD